VARELPEGNSEVAGEFSEGVRVNTLRKMLGERFGAKRVRCYEQILASSSSQSRYAYPERRPESLKSRSARLSALHASLALRIPSEDQ